MDKKTLIDQIIAALSAELAAFERSARAAHAEATDEQSKAENKYDTRGLEASYLARGQSRQAAEILQAIREYQSLPLRDFGPADPIDLGALVEVEQGKQSTLYFIGPRAGGTELQIGPETILVITPQSPLCRQLLGRQRGDRFELRLGLTGVVSRVIKVQ